MGHDCIVVAPSLVPKRPGERVKTNRRDAVTLARLLRAGDLTPVWVPDVVHEAVRDLVRARAAASEDLRRKRQQLLSFLLRHGRIYSGRKHWTKMHLHWLAQQKFDHPAQQIVFQDAVDAVGMPPPVCVGSTNKWRKSCRAGRWHRWSKPIKRCAAYPLQWR